MHMLKAKPSNFQISKTEEPASGSIVFLYKANGALPSCN